MNLSKGQYWDVSWSPIRGCSHASPGCDHCWAERMAGRFYRLGEPFHGVAEPILQKWTGEVRLIESELLEAATLQDYRKWAANAEVIYRGD